MKKNIILGGVFLIAACSYQLVKEDKYIDTQAFKTEAYKICLASHQYKNIPAKDRQSACKKDADDFIDTAEKKFREYKADEHNYRLCRSKFPTNELADKCFRQNQEKYYKRELESYRTKFQ